MKTIKYESNDLKIKIIYDINNRISNISITNENKIIVVNFQIKAILNVLKTFNFLKL